MWRARAGQRIARYGRERNKPIEFLVANQPDEIIPTLLS